jgi:hypothetical protein
MILGKNGKNKPIRLLNNQDFRQILMRYGREAKTPDQVRGYGVPECGAPLWCSPPDERFPRRLQHGRQRRQCGTLPTLAYLSAEPRSVGPWCGDVRFGL